MNKELQSKIMEVCIECGGVSRVQYDVGARCNTLLRDFNHKTGTN